MRRVDDRDLRAVAAAFGLDGTWLGAERLGHGHIHETWVAAFGRGGTRPERYVHQALNERVFPDVSGLMRNLEIVTNHLARHAASEATERWEVLDLVRSREGCTWWRDAAGRAWRTFRYIEGARSYEIAETPAIAREVASAFGRFGRDLADLDPGTLVEPLARFHDLAPRLARLREAVARDVAGRVGRAQPEIDAVRAHEGILGEWAALRGSGGLPLRVVHNDTKVNNALLDSASGRAVAVVDLDTVMPGTFLYDYGDLVRSGACRAAEDERDLGRVHVDLDLFRALTEGYARRVAPVATATELEHLLLGGRYMTYLIGVRFLTDHLEGDRYFRARRPDHNLERARVQLALLRSLEANEGRLYSIVRTVLREVQAGVR